MPRPLQDPYEEPSEERLKAAVKSIEAKGVKVVEIIENEKAHHKLLEYVDSGFEEAVRLKLPLPGAIKVDRSYAVRIKKVLELPFAYDPENDALLIIPIRYSFRQARSI